LRRRSAWHGLLAGAALALLAPASLPATAATTAAAAPIIIGLLQRDADARLDERRVALAYPGHPGGPASQAVELALKESAFALDAAGVAVRLETASAATPADAQAAAARLGRSGAVALIADLAPDALLAAAAAAPSLPIINAGEAADILRERDCRPNLFHTLPSERMRADALAQHLAARRWQRVLLLHGEAPADAPRTQAALASIKRHGLALAAQRPFKLSTDPRERDRANLLLLTGGVEYDVVWVVDGDGEFARALPYRTALPRPVVGDAGLVALAWAPRFERYGAPQLARRFERHAGRPMTGHDWAAWIAVKAVVQTVVDARVAKAGGQRPHEAGAPKPGAPAPAPALAPDAAIDGFKGVRLSFRAWDRQLRQPLLLGDGLGVVAIAPLDGFLHRTNALDTLGADAPEGLCRIAP
jgi:ABC transporter substrate binding protein (PQQ-dependent alcohol dehydrogenase system)